MLLLLLRTQCMRNEKIIFREQSGMHKREYVTKNFHFKLLPTQFCCSRYLNILSERFAFFWVLGDS